MEFLGRAVTRTGFYKSRPKQVSPSLWKAGRELVVDLDDPGGWRAHEIFDDMEDLRRCGFHDDGPEACKLTSVGVYWDHLSSAIVLHTSFRSRDGHGVSFRRADPARISSKVHADLKHDEVLTGIVGTWYTCRMCYHDDGEEPEEPVLRVLNTRTGKTTFVGHALRQDHNHAQVLEAPPGFCIVGFHGTVRSPLFGSGMYFRRFTPSWIDRSPAIPVSQAQVYPRAFAAEHDSYLKAKQVRGSPVSTLCSDADNAILSWLLEMHMARAQGGGLLYTEMWRPWEEWEEHAWDGWHALEDENQVIGRRVPQAAPHAREWLCEEREMRLERTRRKAARRRRHNELAKKRRGHNGLAKKTTSCEMWNSCSCT